MRPRQGAAFVVVDATPSSMAEAKIALAREQAADPARRQLYRLRYDGGAYLVVRYEPGSAP